MVHLDLKFTVNPKILAGPVVLKSLAEAVSIKMETKNLIFLMYPLTIHNRVVEEEKNLLKKTPSIMIKLHHQMKINFQILLIAMELVTTIKGVIKNLLFTLHLSNSLKIR